MRGEQPRAQVEVQLHPITRPPRELEVHIATREGAYGTPFAVHAHTRSRRPPGNAQRKSPGLARSVLHNERYAATPRVVARHGHADTRGIDLRTAVLVDLQPALVHRREVVRQ